MQNPCAFFPSTQANQIGTISKNLTIAPVVDRGVLEQIALSVLATAL